jgi:hypothetical protein
MLARRFTRREEVMQPTDKARQILAEIGYTAGIHLARMHRQGSTDQTGRAYWDRVFEALKASQRPDSAVILQFRGVIR